MDEYTRAFSPVTDKDLQIHEILTAVYAALDGAYYTVARRGGFTNSEQIAPLKKRTVHLLGAGSTFRRRFAGTVLDLGVGMPHPVWRYARGMFMGVNA